MVISQAAVTSPQTSASDSTAQVPIKQQRHAIAPIAATGHAQLGERQAHRQTARGRHGNAIGNMAAPGFPDGLPAG